HRAPCGGPQSERRPSRSRRVYARPRVRPPVKAVIPAAGLGTRFLPLTKEQPKEMLPVVDRPAIHWVVAEAVASGVTDILIVTGREKRAIEDYFDASPKWDARRRPPTTASSLRARPWTTAPSRWPISWKSRPRRKPRRGWASPARTSSRRPYSRRSERRSPGRTARSN